ncbi:MAG: UDP-glucose 4-epimerase GalE [Terriglobales bacterium]
MAPCILVTGGAGYIGSHVVLRLQADFHVAVLDNLSCGHRQLLPPGTEFHHLDLRDRAGVSALFRDHHFDAVIHFAARAYVGESMQQPGRYFENNVTGTQNLLDAMTGTGVSTLVFSSTCAVYGTPQAPLNETHRLAPINPYGESKAMVERMLHWYHQIHGLRYLALRYFNAAGADPQGRSGEWHEPEPHLIPRLLAAAEANLPFPVYGTDFPTRDGSCIRDFIHVTDLAEAHVAGLRYLEQGGAPGSVNLGTGTGISVLDAVARAQAVLDRPIAVEPQPRRAGDPAELVASADRAREMLGWVPQHSRFDHILRDAWAWQQRLPAIRKLAIAAHA